MVGCRFMMESNAAGGADARHRSSARRAVAARGLVAVAASITMLITAGSSVAAASPRAHLVAVIPSTGTEGAPMTISGHLRGAPRGATVIVQTKQTSKWRPLGRARIVRGRFRIIFTIPKGSHSLQVRLIALKGRRRLASSRVRRVSLKGPLGMVLGVKASAGVTSQGVGSGTPPSGETPPSLPIRETAPAIAVMVGSGGDVTLPAPLTAVTSIDRTVTGSPAGVQLSAREGTIELAVEADTPPQSVTLAVSG